MIVMLLCCLMTTHKKVGIIDIIENDVCSVQLDDETYIVVKSSICKGLSEGDTVEVRYDTHR